MFFCGGYYCIRFHPHFTSFAFSLAVITQQLYCFTTMPYSDPKFPVVNADPEVDDCIKSMRFRDWAVLGGITAGSWGYGYIMGKPARMPTASTAAALGLTFASFVVLQNTRDRLMGYKENAREVGKFGGVAPPKRPTQDPRFPTALKEPTRPPLNWKNYE